MLVSKSVVASPKMLFSSKAAKIFLKVQSVRRRIGQEVVRSRDDYGEAELLVSIQQPPPNSFAALICRP